MDIDFNKKEEDIINIDDINDDNIVIAYGKKHRPIVLMKVKMPYDDTEPGYQWKTTNGAEYIVDNDKPYQSIKTAILCLKDRYPDIKLKVY